MVLSTPFLFYLCKNKSQSWPYECYQQIYHQLAHSMTIENIFYISHFILYKRNVSERFVGCVCFEMTTGSHSFEQRAFHCNFLFKAAASVDPMRWRRVPGPCTESKPVIRSTEKPASGTSGDCFLLIRQSKNIWLRPEKPEARRWPPLALCLVQSLAKVSFFCSSQQQHALMLLDARHGAS